RTRLLFGDHRLEAWTRDLPFQAPRLVVETADGGELLVLAELRLLDRRLQHADRLVVDPGRDREGMAVLAAVGEREAGRVGEAAGGAVDHFGYHGERADGAGADAWDEEKVREVLWARIGSGGECAVEAAEDHVVGADVVMV